MAKKGKRVQKRWQKAEEGRGEGVGISGNHGRQEGGGGRGGKEIRQNFSFSTVVFEEKPLLFFLKKNCFSLSPKKIREKRKGKPDCKNSLLT